MWHVKNMTYKISTQSVDCDVVTMSKRMVYSIFIAGKQTWGLSMSSRVVRDDFSNDCSALHVLSSCYIIVVMYAGVSRWIWLYSKVHKVFSVEKITNRKEKQRFGEKEAHISSFMGEKNPSTDCTCTRCNLKIMSIHVAQSTRILWRWLRPGSVCVLDSCKHSNLDAVRVSQSDRVLTGPICGSLTRLGRRQDWKKRW